MRAFYFLIPLALLFATASSRPSLALEITTTKVLANYCAGKSIEGAAVTEDDIGLSLTYCVAYLGAIHDANEANKQSGGLRAFCPKASTNLLEDGRSKFVAWAEAHPGHRNSNASAAVLEAFREAYPCPQLR